MRTVTRNINSLQSRRLLKDPVSALTHFLGIILSIVGLIILINKSADLLHHIAFFIFGFSLIFLYTASTVYHSLDLSEKINLILRKIDHMMIYVLIAGTYTPICMLALPGLWSKGLLITIWSVAVAGIVLTIVWFEAPRCLTTAIYILMGWLLVIAMVPLVKTLSLTGMTWLLAGGILYTTGGIIYASKRPDISFAFFGFHEIFHLFVLSGSFCHFMLMLNCIMYL